MRSARHFQRSVNSSQAMIQERVLVVWPPSRTRNVVDFEDYRKFSAETTITFDKQ